MAQSISRLFLHLKSEPNPNANSTLWLHRLRQQRPLSRNPFESDGDPITDYELSVIESPGVVPSLQAQSSDKASENSKAWLVAQRRNKNRDLEWGEQIPGWLNLFFDLAWTATFSSLTSNNKFADPWDSVSYVVFFGTAWWLWVSQVTYNIDFYTDDWFHLLWIFLQLVVFGALAATTTDFDVRNYITRSPGATQLEVFDIMNATPEQYNANRLAKISLHVIMAVLAISRVLLLVQYARVAYYAKRTSKSGRIPRKLLLVSTSLVVSACLFFAGFVVTMKESSRQPEGAKLKFVYWGSALLVEVVVHLVTLHMDIDRGIRLLSHGSITGRLNDITTIILGEGINAIAQTFYAVLLAPGFGKTAAVSILCCGIIVFFLAYLYFEGAAPLKTVRRRAAWMIMHLPWLLSVILLLEGVKNQLLLTNFLKTSENFSGLFSSALDDLLEDREAQFNATMSPLLLQSGTTLDREWGKYYAALEKIAGADGATDDDLANALITWAMRVQLTGIWGTYNTFMKNGTIAEATYKKIEQYWTNDTVTMEDALAPGSNTPKFDEILEELLKSSLTHSRYIVALAGATFVCLATMNLIQSWPRDRFHWASIISRYVMGICMLCLLLLNIGKYQHFMLTEDQDQSQWAVVFKWVNVSWVLPTIAIGYILQFTVDTFVMYYAVKYGKKQITADTAQTKLPEDNI